MLETPKAFRYYKDDGASSICFISDNPKGCTMDYQQETTKYRQSELAMKDRPIFQ
jgi:hypothetical protein